jgi:hypothetical protein
MAVRKTSTPTVDLAQEQIILEERKIKALEKIAVSLDALTLWFEDIDRNEWSDRIQFYLAKWLELQEQKTK